MAVNKVDLKTDRAGKPFDDVEDVESARLYASILAELHAKATKVTHACWPVPMTIEGRKPGNS